MNEQNRTPLSFDLSALPDGFRNAVERTFDPHKRWRDSPEIALAYAIGEAWTSSTVDQRQAAGAGVNAALKAAMTPGKERVNSYIVGVIGTLCDDLDMTFTDGWPSDESSVLRGLWDAGGVRINSALVDIMDIYISTLDSDAYSEP